MAGFRILKEVAPNVQFWLDVDVYYEQHDVVVTHVEPADEGGWTKLIEELDRAAARPAALAEFGLVDDRPTLLVTGGSLGARRLNGTVSARARELTAAAEK